MIQVLLPDNSTHKLGFYLAMEEYLAGNAEEEMFFLWRTSPTVIYGRNQSLEDEVNVNFCDSHNIDIIRRKSGGGCVYSDEGNLMISKIAPGTDVEREFLTYLDDLCSALRLLGFNAVSSEHNDVMIDGRKVSGNACYAMPRSTIIHGTMLYDVDFSVMQQAITPSQAKLARHSVKSVRQRVVNLVDIDPGMTMERLISGITSRMKSGSIVLTSAQMAEIKEIERLYGR